MQGGASPGEVAPTWFSPTIAIRSRPISIRPFLKAAGWELSWACGKCREWGRLLPSLITQAPVSLPRNYIPTLVSMHPSHSRSYRRAAVLCKLGMRNRLWVNGPFHFRMKAFSTQWRGEVKTRLRILISISIPISCCTWPSQLN